MSFALFWRPLCLVVLVGALGGCGGEPAAPPTSALSLAPHTRVVASVSGGSAVDSANDHRRFRYMVISGPAGVLGPRLLAAEIRALRSHGWTHQQQWVEDPDPTRFNARALPATLATPGVSVLLDSQDHQHYGALSVTTNRRDGLQQALPYLYGNGAVAHALNGQHPLVWILLANGRAPHITTYKSPDQP